MDLNKIQSGAQLFIATKGLLPDGIRFYMKRLGKQLGKDYFPKWNHTETIISVSMDFWQKYLQKEYGDPEFINGEILCSVGARKRGAEITPLRQYLDQHPDHLIRNPVNFLTTWEKKSQELYAELICFKQKRKYQVGNFLAWDLLVRSFGRIRIMGRSDNKVYCYELQDRFSWWVWRGSSTDQFVNIYELLENPNYKDI